MQQSTPTLREGAEPEFSPSANVDRLISETERAKISDPVLAEPSPSDSPLPSGG